MKTLREEIETQKAMFSLQQKESEEEKEIYVIGEKPYGHD